MTSEEMREMNTKLVAERFLSNKCGTCNDCEFAITTVLIGNAHVTLCHLIYSILREDRKQGVNTQTTKVDGILGRV